MRGVLLVFVATFVAACRYGFAETSSGDSGMSATSVRVSISAASAIAVVELDARLAFASLDPDELHAIPATGGAPALPSDATFALPDTSGPLVVTLSARDMAGRALVASAMVDIVAFQQQTLAIALGDDLAGHCVDGVRDADESDVDCGGSCPGCGVGGTCNALGDCATTSCIAGACEPASGPPGWSPIAAMPIARIGLGAALGSDGLIYVFGGGATDGVQTGETDAYDPATDTWSAAPAMTVARTRLAGTAGGDGSVYALGGQVGSNPVATVEHYAPGGASWIAVAPLPTARVFLAAASVGGTVYAVGGDDGASLGLLEASTGASWSDDAPMPTPRSNLAAAFDATGGLVVVGGHDHAETTYYKTAEAFDPMTGTWTTLPAMTHGRSDLAAALGPDGRIYSLGGYVPSTGGQTYVEAHRPGSGWIDVTPLASGRDAGAAAIGPDGRIYMFGGRSTTVALASAEAYGPRLRLATTTGRVGDSIEITGANFASAANVVLSFDGVPLEHAVTDASGALPQGTVLHVPAVAPGPHVVRAIDDHSLYPVTVAFTTE